MNQQREFMSETFHTLSQPITALRATIELGLLMPTAKPPAKVLEDCLGLLDRLMQDLSVLREIAGLDEEPPLELCDGRALLESCVREMAPVAEAGGVGIYLEAEAAKFLCNTQMFQRAVFLMLDEMIAGSEQNGEIKIWLHRGEDGFQLSFYPGTAAGARQKLCSKLMQFAGGSDICAIPDSTGIKFRNR